MKKTCILFLTVAMMVLIALPGAFAGGQAEDSDEKAPPKKVLTIGVDQEAVGLDPHIVTAFSSMRRIDLLYNRLVRLDENLAVVPDLAESWEIPDNLTYIFHLKQGVKFHNGRELTAEDVKYSFERILDSETGSPGRSYIALVEDIEVLDTYTVKLSLSSPLASLFYDVIVVCDPADYQWIMDEYKQKGSLSMHSRRYLAGKVFRLMSEYDGAIADRPQETNVAKSYLCGTGWDGACRAERSADKPKVRLLDFYWRNSHNN